MDLLAAQTAFPRRRFFISAFISITIFFCASSPLADTVTDDVGRTVHIPENPQRIVSLAPSVTEILFALGLDKKIVGVTQFSDYPAEASSKEMIGTYIRPNIEKVTALRPDLVVATAGGNPKKVIAQLEALGLVVFTIFPKEIEDVYQSIRTVGNITGTLDKAKVLASSMEKEMNEIADRVKGREKKKVFFQLGTTPLHTTGSGTFVDRLIIMAGGINIAGQEKTRYPVYSMEAVIMGKPDLIFSAVMGTDRGDAIEFWGKWKSVPAVRKGRIYKVNPDLSNRPSPRIVEGLKEMAMLIHPEAFEKGE